jgi:hypothetical protein
MAQESSRHHYVPAFYLAQFNHGGGQDDPFYIFDLEHQKRWKSTPRGSGHEKDFYRVEVDGVDPLVIENEFLRDQVETPAAPALKRILATARGSANVGARWAVVDPEDLSRLLMFVAVQAVRGPDHRAHLDDLYTQVATSIMQRLAASDESFEQHKAVDSSLADLSRDDVKKVLRDPKLRMTVDRATQISTFLPLVPTVLETLWQRSWGLSLVPPGSPALITTDKPVVRIPHSSLPDGMPVGFGSPGSSVIMPLARNAVLRGHWLDAPSEERVEVRYMSADEVPLVNQIVASVAHRFVYCADDDFVLAADLEGGCEAYQELFKRAKSGIRERDLRAQRQAQRRGR